MWKWGTRYMYIPPIKTFFHIHFTSNFVLLRKKYKFHRVVLKKKVNIILFLFRYSGFIPAYILDKLISITLRLII